MAQDGGGLLERAAEVLMNRDVRDGFDSGAVGVASFVVLTL